ncbi:hypothetical protein OpiT1DRAFT_03799 [Opitutaceae bacterium TAV1]|nr:hypothetical protein OpiT1DRAFT_03799 [Opitutaceae bacterium TAV1]
MVRQRRASVSASRALTSLNPSDPVPTRSLTPGSLRRALDVVLRKPVYLAQFRRLAGEPQPLRKPGRQRTTPGPATAGQFLRVLLREGLAKNRHPGKTTCNAPHRLTRRGFELLSVLDDLGELDRLARTGARSAAATVRRVLRERGIPACLDCLPLADSFTADDIQHLLPERPTRYETSLMLRFLKTRGILVRTRLTQHQPCVYRMTDYGIGIRRFLVRLRELDAGATSAAGASTGLIRLDAPAPDAVGDFEPVPPSLCRHTA